MSKRPKVGPTSETGEFLRIRSAEVTFEAEGDRPEETRVFESLERGDAVAAVVYDRDAGCILLVRQFRYPTYEKTDDGYVVELVAGMLKEGEEAEQAMAREISEEVGYMPTSIQLIRTFFVSPGGSSERIHLFYAEVGSHQRSGDGGGLVEETERIEIISWEVETLQDRIQAGEVVDAKTLIGLDWFLTAHPHSGVEQPEKRRLPRTRAQLENFGRTCFVIMPFGEKKDHAGREIDFDELYDYLIRPAVEELGIECERCDRIPGAGVIHERMFAQILEADVVVVDTTTLNPNVFYELGIRHALCDAVTVLIRRSGELSPFNIAPDSAISYDFTPRALNEAKKNIQAFITAGLHTNKSDSPVHTFLDYSVRLPEPAVERQEWYRYEVRGMPGRHIGIVTGSLDRIRNVDVWVNSENTDLEMARCAELSVSALIRYLGAEKTAGRVTKDSIQDYLRIYSDGIAPGSVVRTEPGRLADRGVRLILHAATAFGEPGSGYSPIKNLPGCVTACLEEFTSFASEQDEGDKPRSILLPLFGTGTARGDLRSAANKLLETAVAFLHDRGEAATDVWFLAYSQRQLNVCRSVLDADRTLNRRPGTRNPYV